MSENLNVAMSENGEGTAENGEALQDTANEGTRTSDEGENDTQETLKTGESDGEDTAEESDGVDTAEESDGEEGEPVSEEVFNFDDGTQVKKSQVQAIIRENQKYQDMAENIELLEMIAASSQRSDGTEYENVTEFVQSLKEAIDNNLYEECLDLADGNEEVADELFESRKAKRDKRWNDIKLDRESQNAKKAQETTQRVASEFEALQKEFPEYKDYLGLEKEVKDYAMQNNVSLLTAKLLIDRRNANATQKQLNKQAENKKASLGSKQSDKIDGEGLLIEAMRQGFQN